MTDRTSGGQQKLEAHVRQNAAGKQHTAKGFDQWHDAGG